MFLLLSSCHIILPSRPQSKNIGRISLKVKDSGKGGTCVVLDGQRWLIPLMSGQDGMTSFNHFLIEISKKSRKALSAF